MSDSQPLKLFIVYAREDQPALLELKAHLRPLEKRGDLMVWDDGEILPGQDWDKAIKKQLAAADIVLLFISKHFFTSEYIEKEELKKALERHKKGETVVVPVIVKPCLWDAHEEIAVLQVLPKDGKPVSSWDDADEAWASIAREMRRVIERGKTQTPQTKKEQPQSKKTESIIAAQKVEEGREAFLNKNYEEAFQLLSTFCDSEYEVNLDGYVKLGYMYQHGLGVKPNLNEAIKWYRKAAERGNAWGKNNLGWMYHNGYGVAPDLIEAAKWYREAAEQGLHVAKENLQRLGYSE